MTWKTRHNTLLLQDYFTTDVGSNTSNKDAPEQSGAFFVNWHKNQCAVALEQMIDAHAARLRVSHRKHKIMNASSKPIENYYGVDLDMIDYNLSLTPEQRLVYHQSALDLIIELETSRNPIETKPQRTLEAIYRP